MELGALIKQYIDEHGMSLRSFAEKAHLTPALISFYINGKNGKRISAKEDNLRKIATAMHITLGELVECLDNDEVVSFGTVDFDKLLEAYNSLAPDKQQMLLKYADFLRQL